MSKLNLDRDKVASCRHLAGKIARRVQDYVDRHTTVSIERATLRLLGIEEAHEGRPLVNVVTESLSAEELSRGILHWIGRALAHRDMTPAAVCLHVAEGKGRFQDLPEVDPEALRGVTEPLAQQAIRRLHESLEKRKKTQREMAGRHSRPLKYVIVATGNIHHDVEQASAAVSAGADCIAVIRSTAQSLLDYVPHGATTEGFGGTFATQENFRIMREALDGAGRKAGRYIRLVNYSSGLCMSEIAAMAAAERLDYLLNDSMYGILFRDINMGRTFTDQYFSRRIIAHAGITINTGEDNYLTTAESYRAFPQVLASQFINEQLALLAGLKEEQIGLGHAFEMDPKIEDSFLYEIAQAEAVREIFPRSPVKYMPPTRHMTGDIFFGHALDTMFHLVSVLTQQEICLLGMPTEGIHNPLLQDRFVALKGAGYIFGAARDLGDEIDWNENGKVVRRARSVLDDAHKMLGKVDRIGLMKAIAEGLFANMPREEEGGWGRDGVLVRDSHYWNPIWRLLEQEQPPEIEESVGRWRPAPMPAEGERRTERRRQSRGSGAPYRGRSRGGRGRGRGRRSGPPAAPAVSEPASSEEAPPPASRTDTQTESS